MRHFLYSCLDYPGPTIFAAAAVQAEDADEPVQAENDDDDEEPLSRKRQRLRSARQHAV